MLANLMILSYLTKKSALNMKRYGNSYEKYVYLQLKYKQIK